MTPLVSVLTPVFNGAPYLAECIESVLAQTYANWEYTIVDNGSRDASRAIAQSYAARDSRVRVVAFDEPVGQIQSLNRTVRLLSDASVYCKLAFADDWLFPGCLSDMVEVAERHPTVAIVGAYCLKDRRVICHGLPFPSPVTNGREICREALRGRLYVFGTPNGLLYRSDVVRSRAPSFFDEAATNAADADVCYRVLAEHDFGFVHRVLTFTREGNESVSTAWKTFDPDYLLTHLALGVRHGPAYLEPDDCAARIDWLERRYYRFLADRLLFGPSGSTFWAFHTSGLGAAGRALRVSKLVASCPAAAARRFAQWRGWAG